MNEEILLTQDEPNSLMIGAREVNDYQVSGIIQNVLDDLYKLRMRKDYLTGMSSGLEDLDRITLGFQSSDLVVIASRPSMGKTALALNILRHTALKGNKTAAMFTLDMSGEDIISNVIAKESRVDRYQMRLGVISDEEWDRINKCANDIDNSHMIIDDKCGTSVYKIISRCRDYSQKYGLQLVIIDYLQLMTARDNHAYRSREQELDNIVRALKGLAHELDIPVIILSELPDEVDIRADHRPMLSDLRGYGNIRHYADRVMFIYRDSYYYNDAEERDVTEIIIEKNVGGPIGTVRVKWDSIYGGFETI